MSETVRTRVSRQVLLMSWALKKGHYLGAENYGAIRRLLELDFSAICMVTILSFERDLWFVS